MAKNKFEEEYKGEGGITTYSKMKNNIYLETISI